MNINRTVVVPYSAADMYALVDDIESYPQFLPWCDGVSVQRDRDQVKAQIAVAYRGLRTGFTTRNEHTPATAIRMELVQGPLSSLTGEWRFIELDEQRCRIELQLQYEFSNRLMTIAFGKIFSFIFDSFVDHFIQRAHRQYRKITVEIAKVVDNGLQKKTLLLPLNTTVADALAAAGLSYSNAVSVFGKLCDQDTLLTNGDRIEINQPLPNPPRQARRQRQ